MNNQFSNIDFESLVTYVKQLSEFEKNKLLAALLENQFPMVNEEVSVYSKALTKNKEFEKKWSESLTSEQFKNAAIQHLDSLPWK